MSRQLLFRLINKRLGRSCAVRTVDSCVWTSPSKPAALLPHAEDFHTLPSSAAFKYRSLQSVWTSPSKSALLPLAEDFHTLPSSADLKNSSLQSGNPYGAARRNGCSEYCLLYGDEGLLSGDEARDVVIAMARKNIVEGYEGSVIGEPLVNPFVGVAGVIHYENSHRIKAIPIDEVLKCL